MNSVIASTQKLFEWLTTEFQNLLEQPVETTLQVLPGQPVGDFLSLAGKIDIVCQIVLPSAPDGKARHGTGFLISNGLLLTNNHVLPDLATATLSKARFFYELGKEPVEVELNPDVQKNGFFFTSPTPDSTGKKPLTQNQLDFTIVAINHHTRISKVYHQSFSIFESVNLQKNEKANIIQHPAGEDLTGEKEPYKRIAFRDNTILEIDRKNFIVHYQTPTKPGSSGSPVMNDEARLFGLHRSRCTNHTNCNTAILMDAIAAEIRRKGLLDKIQKRSSPSSNYTKKIGLPMEQNENFVGREEELRVIKQAFSSSSRPIALVAETGQGGIGKTQLALQYAYSSQDYEVVVWIQANTPETIKYSFREFAKKIGIELTDEEKKQEKDNLLIKALEWFQMNDNWLIIFDNAESPPEIFSYSFKVTPSDSENPGNRHILITSRFTIWKDHAIVVPVQLFTKEQSLSLIEKILEKDELIFKEEKEMEQLVTLLGNLPLAVSHAAYYIRNKANISILRYIQQLQEIPGLILDENQDLSSFRYENTVKATFITSMNHICELEQKNGRTVSPITKEILYICSFFNSNNIPTEVLEKWFCKEKPGSTTQFLFDNAISLLRNYSLIGVEKGNISLHPLVHTIARDSIPNEEKNRWFSKATDSLMERWKDPPIGDFFKPQLKLYEVPNPTLFPHLIALYSFHTAFQYGENSEQVSIIFCKFVSWVFMYPFSDLEISIDTLEKFLASSEKIVVNPFYKAELDYTLGLMEIRKNSYYQLAVFDVESNFMRAKNHFESALETLKKVAQEEKTSELSAKIIYFLSFCHEALEQYELAENNLIHVQKVCELKYGLQSGIVSNLHERFLSFGKRREQFTKILKLYGLTQEIWLVAVEIMFIKSKQHHEYMSDLAINQELISWIAALENLSYACEAYTQFLTSLLDKFPLEHFIISAYIFKINNLKENLLKKFTDGTEQCSETDFDLTYTKTQAHEIDELVENEAQKLQDNYRTIWKEAEQLLTINPNDERALEDLQKINVFLRQPEEALKYGLKRLEVLKNKHENQAHLENFSSAAVHFNQKKKFLFLQIRLFLFKTLLLTMPFKVLKSIILGSITKQETTAFLIVPFS